MFNNVDYLEKQRELKIQNFMQINEVIFSNVNTILHKINTQNYCEYSPYADNIIRLWVALNKLGYSSFDVDKIWNMFLRNNNLIVVDILTDRQKVFFNIPYEDNKKYILKSMY